MTPARRRKCHYNIRRNLRRAAIWAGLVEPEWYDVEPAQPVRTIQGAALRSALQRLANGGDT